MITVYKYPLRLTWEQTVELPMGAHLLYVGLQHEQLQLWAKVDTEAKTNRRKIYIIGTGHDFSVKEPPTKYVNTFFVSSGTFVFHVFDGGWE